MVEEKWFDSDVSVPPVNFSNGVLGDRFLLEIPQGTDVSERIGRKIVVTWLGFRISLVCDNSKVPFPGNFAGNVIRVVFALDKQWNGSLGADEWYDAPAEVPFVFSDLSESERFNILYDESFYFNCSAAFTGKSWAKTTYIFADCMDLEIPVYYSGGVGSVTELTSNNIVFWMFRTEPTALDPQIDVDYHIRIRYIDA